LGANTHQSIFLKVCGEWLYGRYLKIVRKTGLLLKCINVNRTYFDFVEHKVQKVSPPPHKYLVYKVLHEVFGKTKKWTYATLPLSIMFFKTLRKTT
jgi:hypothetical protein